MTDPSPAEPDPRDAPHPQDGGSLPAPPGRRPPQVLAAAAIGFFLAFYVLMYALLLLAATRVLGAASAAFGTVYLAVAVANTWGAVMALKGRGSAVLKVAGLVTAGLAVLGLVVSLAQGGFTIWSVLLIAAGAGIVLLLNQPSSRQYFAARGTR
ncbi:hypothetical protein [Geodermatophilus sp. SYSU D01105]